MKKLLTDNQHRVNYLITRGWNRKDAQYYVLRHPAGFSESWYLIGQRVKEFGKVIKEGFKR